ncbi:MAG TPA: ABC transporter permease, partial [Aestuariivirga sp.]|nr:ABC transporter permease [Aestuariivirga sp.]
MLILERRVERARLWMWASPVLALVLTIIAGGIIFALAGVDPLHGLYTYFISPLMDGWDREKLIAKAAPLVLIGVGLAVCYTANV